jgi:hypothetical protein
LVVGHNFRLLILGTDPPLYAGQRGAWNLARLSPLVDYESVIPMINEFAFGVAMAAFAVRVGKGRAKFGGGSKVGPASRRDKD